ncbi:MAG TPA: bifunctional diaminohydroxyphosphoribosylaminopyrimidine deaminase/5-amino-6-(5-phosphoribosylamino)uracil reductase RibD [Saprospiraceae bacterium]|nr:bifunctional diaminohydroxyphosphoribosylaminopyrimidine deaminase/5-amino-6-(5-phosphoribosylamino)uracil reductase RibD [Saprospiraceae bacterium]HMQ81837.1 bifunctional diaminohydroxyphosphoribosylaminopyrimidine deaminase/5-amino-6-(5-phosphoribosylamino)uracil reductase RibD [Saprospiraceae bacterium]
MGRPQELYIQRCFDLARLGAGSTSPNPMVGAVLVHEDRIIGEGYHQRYGQAHAEVNAITAVAPSDLPLIPYSTLYVSLEPCDIVGKTPACTDLILRCRIPKVVVSCLDHTPGVNGQGIQRLRQNGVEVVEHVLETKGKRIAAIRNTYVTEKRPYIILKFAQTADGFFAPSDHRQLWISNAYTKRLVHQWRSEVDAIMVGTRTAAIDRPQLSNRLYFGKSPLRFVLDRKGILPAESPIFDAAAPTIRVTETGEETLGIWNIPFDDSLLPELMKRMAASPLSSLLVEGGAQLIQSFLDAQLWDEARVITGQKRLKKGLYAPVIPVEPIHYTHLGNDQLAFYYRNEFKS